MSGKLGRRAAKKLEDELTETREDVVRLQRDMDGLLDILNAVLMASGGKIVVSQAQLVAATRREIEVMHHPTGITITARSGPKPDELPTGQEQDTSVLDRLWLPGR